ncbi:MAG: hypothetical protein QM679_13215, partial [Patulibacter sp.]
MIWPVLWPVLWPVGRTATALLTAAALLTWLVLPSAPGYDTATHLVWARELLAGRPPEVTAAAAPTMHPLWLALSVPAVATGAGASVLQLLDLLSLALVVACVWRLAADIAGAVAGLLAAVALGSSFALLLLAFKAYVDLPFLALALLALVIERDRDARDAASAGRLLVPALLAGAGLLRPEAWGLGLLLVALRWGRGGEPRTLAVPALVVLAAPLAWAAVDLILTGDPLHSLTGTQELAAALGRKTGLGNAPIELVRQLGDLARPPVAAAGVLGVALAVWRIGTWPLVVLLAPLAFAVAGFLLVGALGLPLLQRYLLVPSALLGVFAGVAGAALIAAAFGRPLPGALGARQEAGARVAPS